MIWEWANDPTVRARSFTTDPIPWDEHVGWYAGKLADPNCVFYVVLGDGGTPIGQVRFDISGLQATVSVGLAPAARGLGYGSVVIRTACHAVLADRRVGRVLPLIRQENEASVRSFANAGFARDGQTMVRDFPAHRYVLKSNDISSHITAND
jgi:RimJ/RimL family protein N-acetyltransferase